MHRKVPKGDDTRRRLLANASLAGAALRAGWPLWAAEPAIVVPSYNTFTDEEEIELGKTFDKQMTQEAKFVSEPSLNGYINDVVQRLGRSSRRANLRYSMRIIDVSEVNASAVPGGFMYINRGLLEVVQDESELAAVLAHEIGHVVAHHGTNKLAAIFIGKQFYEIVKHEILRDQQIVSGIIEKLGGSLFLLAQMQYTRNYEIDADKFGYYNMQRAGWHPDGMVTMLQRLLAHSADPNFVEAIFSTHPPTAERIQIIQRELRESPPRADLVHNRANLQEMKSILRTLPAPRMKRMPH